MRGSGWAGSRGPVRDGLGTNSRQPLLSQSEEARGESRVTGTQWKS